MNPLGPLSYSGYSLYQKCPSAFKRKYLLKEKGAGKPSREEAPQMYRGTDVHTNVEGFFKNEHHDLCEEVSFYHDWMRGLRTAGAIPEMEFCFDKDWNRVPFSDEENGLIRGFIDLHLPDKENKIIHTYEWKTGKMYPEHSDQRHLYGMATLLIYDWCQEAHVTTVYTDLRDNVTVKYPRDMLKTYLWMWERKINSVRPPQPYPMRPSWKCRSCQFSKARGGTCPNQ